MPSCLNNVAPYGYYPLGFINGYAFANFVFLVVNHPAMPDDANLVFHGSSVTGVSFQGGQPFDVGRTSDYDIAIVSEELFKRSLSLDVKTRSMSERTGELQEKDLRTLQIQEVSDRAHMLMGASSTKADRPVHFMIFKTLKEARQGRASLITEVDTSKPKGRRVLLYAQPSGKIPSL